MWLQYTFSQVRVFFVLAILNTVRNASLKKSPVNIRCKSHIKVTHYINMRRYKETKGNFSPCFNSTLSILDLKRQEIVKDLSE